MLQHYWVPEARFVGIQKAISVVVHLPESIHDFAAVRTFRIEPVADLLLAQILVHGAALVVAMLELQELRGELCPD